MPSPFCRNVVGGSLGIAIGALNTAEDDTDPLELFKVVDNGIGCDGAFKAATCSVLHDILISLWHFLWINSLHCIHLNPCRPSPHMRSWQYAHEAL